MRARIDDAAADDDDGDGDDGGDGRKGRRRRARRERAVVMMGLRAAAIAVVMMRGAEGGTPTCAYAARRETCRLGARRAAFDVVGDARCDAIEGDATCAMRSNGVVFEPTSTLRAELERPRVFVVRHDERHGLNEVRAQVDRVLAVCRPGDEAVALITSPGGEVSAMGLIASQFARLRKKTRLTACVDTIAASGGYMSACVAPTILAAPFALIGSVGVVTYVPNVQKVLEKHDVDMHLLTAGAHKRTVDVVGTVTPEDLKKANEELKLIHDAFKAHCVKYRPNLEPHIETVATGEAWLATHALSLGLVDAVATSDEYLADKAFCADVFDLVPQKPKSPLLKMLQGGDDDVFDPGASASATTLRDDLATRAPLLRAFPAVFFAPFASGLRWRRALLSALATPARPPNPGAGAGATAAPSRAPRFHALHARSKAHAV